MQRTRTAWSRSTAAITPAFRPGLVGGFLKKATGFGRLGDGDHPRVEESERSVGLSSREGLEFRGERGHDLRGHGQVLIFFLPDPTH